jgi:NADPH:quinone reductase-like Zn-dependent oxidoreductase
MSYQHVVVTEFGGPEKLKVVTESALPEPGPNQIRVKVLTAGTGFTDTIIRLGQYIDVKDKPPFTLGYDWVGVVDKLGGGVTTLKVGQWVADMPVIGGYTQYLCVDASRVVPIPDTVDPAEAVCMILSYTTAYQMLTRVRAIPRGSVCLVHAAGGAVGTALLELGRLMGLKMYGTASKGKHELVQRLGGIPIDYRNEDFVERIKQETGGQGVDVIFDTLGGKSWARSYKCVKRGGILIAFGALQYTTGEESVLSSTLGFAKLLGLWKLIPDGKASMFYNIHHRRQKLPDEFAQDVQALMKLLADGKLKPAVAGRYPLADAANVHRMIDKAEIAGKVVLVCNSGA